MLRDQPLKTKQAGVTEWVCPDLALFEVGEKDAIDAARQQSGEIVLAEIGGFAIGPGSQSRLVSVSIRSEIAT